MLCWKWCVGNMQSDLKYMQRFVKDSKNECKWREQGSFYNQDRGCIHFFALGRGLIVHTDLFISIQSWIAENESIHIDTAPSPLTTLYMNSLNTMAASSGSSRCCNRSLSETSQLFLYEGIFYSLFYETIYRLPSYHLAGWKPSGYKLLACTAPFGFME